VVLHSLFPDDVSIDCSLRGLGYKVALVGLPCDSINTLRFYITDWHGTSHHKCTNR